MSVEAAVYPKDLDVSLPSATDGLAEGDNHLRLIKSVLKTSFPNLATPYTGIDFVGVPIGGIILWYSSVGTIPTGFVLCSGQTVARSDGGGNITAPDLRERFVLGAGTSTPGATGGSQTPTITSAVTIVEGGGHVITASVNTDVAGAVEERVTGAHTLVLAELPPVVQVASGSGTSVVGSVGAVTAHSHTIPAIASHNHTVNLNIDQVAGHTHGTIATASTADGRPPYYALAYIMRI